MAPPHYQVPIQTQKNKNSPFPPSFSTTSSLLRHLTPPETFIQNKLGYKLYESRNFAHYCISRTQTGLGITINRQINQSINGQKVFGGLRNEWRNEWKNTQRSSLTPPPFLVFLLSEHNIVKAPSLITGSREWKFNIHLLSRIAVFRRIP